MSNQVVVLPQGRPVPCQPVSFSEMVQLAESIAKSGLFGMKEPAQALALMAIAQAEGRHPALAARDYDIIKGKASKKAEAMMRDFIEVGGKVEWHSLDDAIADATFSHPSGGTVRIMWDMARVRTAGISNQDMYKKYPRQMLRSRCVSEGVRTVCPAATSGMYVPEEVADFETRATVIPPATPARQERLAPPSPPPAPKATASGSHAPLTDTEQGALDRNFDPRTGEIIDPPKIDEPPASAVANGWKGWCDNFIAKVSAADTPTNLSKILQTNDRELDLCETAAPELSRAALQAYRNRAAALAEPR